MSIENIKHIVLVSSAKGGVGKSTVTTNLAVALQKKGKSVGVVDCDVYGPSQNNMFRINHQENQDIHLPIESYGIKVNSIANRIAPGKTIAWRGPMLKIAVLDLILETEWDELDYLIVDMPPGTGDIQLAICEKLPQSSAIIVTTPQTVATIDTIRGMDLYQNAGINIIGIIENMCGFVCGHCGNKEYIFGKGGAKKLAKEHNIKFLGEIPIETRVRKGGDFGKPIALNEKENISLIYFKIANKVTRILK